MLVQCSKGNKKVHFLEGMSSMQEAITKNKQHWSGIDYVKGILIIIVFMGHVIPGVLRETYPRYLIYSFHMPLFIGISGFLLNIEKLDIRITSLLKKFWKRMICPWLIAVTVFYIVRNIAGHEQLSVKSFVTAYCVPYYHLWYVLGFLSYLICACFMWFLFRNARYKWLWIFGISSVISFISEWNLLDGRLGEGILNTIYETSQYDFRIYNLVFFMLGIFLRYTYEHNGAISSNKVMEGIRALTIISIICVSVLFFFDYSNMEKIMFYVMNCSLLIVVLFDCVNQRIPESELVEFLGKYSLPIYLYHILCKLAAIYLCEEGTSSYYVVCVISLIVGCVLVYYLRRINIINSLIFGSTTSSLNTKSLK